MALPLVGRADEVDALDAARRSLSDGAGRLVWVSGEPGIGKTSLLDRAAEALDRDGALVLRVGADRTDQRRTLGLVRRLLPEVDRRDLDNGSIEALDRVLDAVERRRREGPLAVLADDVHWADETSVDALHAIARRAPDLGVLVVITARPHPASSGVQQLAELAASAGVELRPQPLDGGQIRELVRKRAGADAGPRLVELLASAGGNPFLTVELLDSLADDGLRPTDAHVVDLADDQVPQALSERLARRALAAVPDGEVVLRAVAAVPGGLTTDELSGVVDRPLAEIIDVVLGAVLADVLVDADATLEFRHDLLRRAIVEGTPRSVVDAWARRAAHLLVERNADPDRVAACLLDGIERVEPGDLDAMLEVGRRHRRTHPVAAADLLARVLGAVPPDDPRSRRLTVDLGWAFVDAGRTGAVQPLLDDRLHGPGIDSAEARLLRDMADALHGRLDDLIERNRGLDATTVAERFDAGDEDTVDSIAELALLRVTTGETTDAGALLDWVEAADVAPTPTRSANVETVRSWLDAIAGRFESSVRHSRAALGWIERDPTRRASAASPTLTLAVSLDQLGESDDALATALGRAAQLVAPRWGPPLLRFFGTVVLYRRGDWDDALHEVEVGFDAAREVEFGMASFWPFAVASLIHTARDELDEAHEMLERAGSSRSALGAEWLALAAAVLHAAEGRGPAAADLVETVVDRSLAAGAPALLLNGGADMVCIALAEDRPVVAERLTTALEDLAARSASPISRAIAMWSVGLRRGDSEALVDAAKLLDGRHRHPEAARAVHHRAVMLARQGDVEAARTVARDGFERYDALGADLWRRELRAELRACGLDIRPRRSPSRPASGWASLTPTEDKVVGLVASGMTNGEVADRLYVSRRTIESHLGRVYTKLALANRAQLAAAAHERTSA